jgi:phage-related minor tail protein
VNLKAQSFDIGTLFHIVWLSAAHQVDSVVLSGYKRIMVKGGMAALYNSIGPAIGVLTAGYIISGQTEALEGYRIVYQYAAGLTVISGILSWEWSTTD